ncbi:hypothetical protein G6F46_015837 [Rhizopus delemar]|nr:hypothetical protein G6F46_015837 [Rhizopus delemar]
MPRIGSGIHTAVLDYTASYRTAMAVNLPFLPPVTVPPVVWPLRAVPRAQRYAGHRDPPMKVPAQTPCP